MADSKITALTSIGTSTDPAVDPLVLVDVSDTSMAATGTTKKVTLNNLLASSPTAANAFTVSGLLTAASATITGDLTVATDRLKVVTGSTAIQTGATTQLQVGTTSWPSTVIGKSGSRSLFGNAGEVIIWNEAAAAIGNYSTLFVSAKTGAGATTMGGLQIRAGIENASNSDGFVSLWTSNSAAGGFVERYKIDSTGVATWSNVGGVAGTRMTLNSTGLGIGTASPSSVLTLKNPAVSGEQTILNIQNATGVTSITKLTYNQDTDALRLINETAYSGATLQLGVNGTDLTIDQSGNVGVGVTPSAWGSNSKALQVGGGTASVSSTGAGSTASRFAHGAYFDNTNWLYQYTGVGPALYQVTGANAGSTHAWYTSAGGTAGNTITDFATAKMTLDASGNLLVGTTSAAAKITALAGASGQAAIFQQPAQNFWCVLAHNQATSGDNSFVLFGTEASFTSRGSITYNRAAGQVAYNITSDYRLKEDIKPLTGAISRITSLKPSTYKLKETGFVCEGFIAHELAEVVPMAVSGAKDAVDADGKPVYQSVDLSKVIPLLVAAIKELTARVEALEA